MENLVERYFWNGYRYDEIIMLLKKQHHIQISKRTLQRYLNHIGLSRRSRPLDSNALLADVHQYLQENGDSHGYRNVRQRLLQRGISYTHEAIRIALLVLDPEGVSRRKARKLKRRKYQCRGPNHAWHIDGNDKLKPYGFYIHGCIDGFSRKIIWLHVANTNKDPSVVSYYFLNEVKRINGTAIKIRADCGSENTSICGIQRFFRRNAEDNFAGERSFQYGKSTSNQRIESWWSILKKDTIQKWIDFFKDLKDNGEYSDADNVQVEALKFSFCGIIQNDLDAVVDYWNNHKIRPSRLSESPDGRPAIIYELPERYDAQDYKFPVNSIDFDLAEREYSSPPKQFCCSNEFAELALMLMEDLNLSMPSSLEDSKMLYTTLVNEVSRL